MAGQLILAVAGAGKTSYLIDHLDENTRTLIITYTNNNYDNIHCRIIRKFGYIPDNIVLFSYFSFLYTFCFKPFLQMEIGAKGINFTSRPNRFAQNLKRYIDNNYQLFSNRITKLLEEYGVISDVKKRLAKYFDHILIDEVQDFGGHDFNFLQSMVSDGPDATLVGDFFQHTFDTSRDGNVNKNLHFDYDGYKARWRKASVAIETELLGRSYRCSPSICDFVTNQLGINIESHRDDETTIALIQDQTEADMIFADDEIIKLFYQNSHKYPCHAKNWGGVKGDDHFDRVCVVLNDVSYKAYQENSLHQQRPSSKNKLYVALTRARSDIYLVSEELYKGFKAG